MKTKIAIHVVLMILVMAITGCGSQSPMGSSSPPPPPPTDISISPTTVAAGNSDLVLTVTGTDFVSAANTKSIVVWSVNGTQTSLQTTFNSSTQLTAVVPAALLVNPLTAQVFVATGDPSGSASLVDSNSMDFTVTSSSSPQATFYVTDEPGERLYELNYATGAITTVYNIGGKPDSLVIDPSTGEIFYSVASLRNLSKFDPLTGTNTIVADFGSSSAIPGYPRDLVLEPGGSTLLLGLYSPGKIVRFDISSGSVTTLSSNLGSVDGLAYDPSGNLFAVANHNTIVQIDPTSGAVLKTLLLEPHSAINGADGLTYDPFSLHLWATTDGSGTGTLDNGLIEIATDLSGFVPFQIGKISVPDGLVPDGQGNLYVASGLAHLMKYNIPSDTILDIVNAPGIDDPVLLP